MPLTLEQEEKLRHMLEVIGESRSKLNAWETTFFDDQVKRYDEHQSKMFLSPKQWAVIHKMYEKVTEA